MAEDEMVGWRDQLSGHEFGWTPGVCDGHGGLACCSPWGHKESDMTERLDLNELMELQRCHALSKTQFFVTKSHKMV